MRSTGVDITEESKQRELLTKCGLKHLKDGEAEGSLRSVLSEEEGEYFEWEDGKWQERQYQLGEGAVALGQHTKGSGKDSFAQGFSSVASGNFSHAEGTATKSVGECSHAEGAGSVASGVASHAGGYGTIASHEAQTAIGKYNKDVDSLLSVGNGEYDEATKQPIRKDAFRVERDGKIYILNEEGNEVLLQELYDDEVRYLMEHKREKAVANWLETYGLEAHGFIIGWRNSTSSIDNPVVGEFVPLYRVKSVNNGKAQVGFTVVSRDNSKGVYKASYYFSSLGNNRVDIIMTHYANHNVGSYFSRDCIGFVPIANREWLIVRKVLTSEEDYMVVTDDMKDKHGGYAIISCFTDNKADSEKQNEADGLNRVILIDSTFSEYEGVNLAENFVPCIDCTGVAKQDDGVLALTQENLNDYYDANTEILQVPAGTKTILFNLPDTKVAAIQMEGVTSGQRITVAGAFIPSEHYSADKNVDGRFSSYLYTYRSGYNMGSNDGRLVDAFEDFMYYYGVWYSKGY